MRRRMIIGVNPELEASLREYHRHLLKKITQRLGFSQHGWHQDYGVSYDTFGADTMKGLAELGLKLREELYAGMTDALKVMKRYCAEGEISSGRSTAAKTLSAILELV